jgi:hypothetical protein
METTTIRDRVTAHHRDASAAPAKPVSVCLLGQPYWAGKLEESLNRFGGSRLSAFELPLNSWRCFGNLRKAVTADLIVSMGFRPGARTLRGRAFDAVWAALHLFNRRAARVFYWLGTDVLNTTKDLQAGKLRRRPFAKAQRDHHLADAPWLAEELGAIGISALPRTLTLPPLAFGPTPELPAEFSVLTYIPDFRHRFYAGDCIYQAARRLPEIRFNVVGGLGTWVTEPLPNLVFHGWQSDMQRFHHNATVLVRLVEHDGTGLTAIEGLSAGRHVIYSHPLPHTIPVAWGDSDALVDALRDLFALHQRASLRLNTAGRAYIKEHFDYDQCMEALMSYFLEIAPRRQGRKEVHHGH